MLRHRRRLLIGTALVLATTALALGAFFTGVVGAAGAGSSAASQRVSFTRVCGAAPAEFASCHAILRTNVRPAAAGT